MKAIKKPIAIEVVRLVLHEPAHPAIRLERLDDRVWTVWNEKHQAWMQVAEGDYINVTDPADVYPIAADVFARTYDVVEE